MKKNKNNKFVRGQKFVATVKAVRREGVAIEMPDGRGSGVISARCWGKGDKREKALAAIRRGDRLEVLVRSFNPLAGTLSLVLAGCGNRKPANKKSLKGKSVAGSVREEPRARKPDFLPIPKGSVLLFDCANLLGKTGAEYAAKIFEGIAGSLASEGFKAMFFMERRTYWWALHNQASQEDASALKAFAAREDFCLIGDGKDADRKNEADAAILQVAEAIPNSVCVSDDRFGDYRAHHPTLVGTERIRSFSVSRFGGNILVCVAGLRSAIVIDTSKPCETLKVANEENAAVEDEKIAVNGKTRTEHKGIFGLADECFHRGDIRKAERFYLMAAKKDSSAYFALADLYEARGSSVADMKRANHYDRLGFRAAKRKMQSERRLRRIRSYAKRAA